MKKNKVVISLLSIGLAAIIGLGGCKKKDDTTFALEEIKAGTIDLNLATPPGDVPTTPTIVATFNLDIDATSVTTANTKMTRIYDNTDIPITLAVSGATITIAPVDALGNGAQFKLTFPIIKATDGQTLAAFDRSFTTLGNFVPAGVVAYYNFENNAEDQVGTYDANAVIDVAYENSYSTDAGKAAYFNGTSTIIEVPNGDQLGTSHDFTLSYWVKTKSDGHVDGNGNPKGHFVMGLGAFKGFQFEIPADYGSCKLAAQYELGDGTTASEDLWFNGSGDISGWQGWTFCKDLTGSGGVAGLIKDKWAHIVCVYNSTSKEGVLYINGEKMKSQDFDLWPVGDPKQGVKGLKWGGVPPEVYPTLAFGFIQSRQGTMWANEPWGGYNFPTANHFGGWLDDIRIFHTALTEQEVSLMYLSEKP